MKLTHEEWKAMPEIVLPWEGKETGFTLTTVTGLCNDCGSELEQLRGNFYEAYGVVEMHMGGICPQCKHLVPCRSRVYPKTGVFAQERDGGWEKGQMITFNQRWKHETIEILKPVALGILACIVATTVFGKNGPSKASYVWWGLISALFFVLAVWGGWFVARKR